VFKYNFQSTGREKHMHEFRTVNMNQKLPKTGMTFHDNFHARFFQRLCEKSWLQIK
jgi:hypothetical protein